MKERIEIDKFEFKSESTELKIQGLKISRDIPIKPKLISKRDERKNRKISNRQWFFFIVNKVLLPIVIGIITGLILKFIERVIFSYPDITIVYYIVILFLNR